MKFDMASLKKIASPNAYKDMDQFLRELPDRAGQTVLIAGAFVWMVAMAGFVFATVEAGKLAQLRADIYKQDALTPEVPKIVNKPVSKDVLEAFVEKAKSQYDQVNIASSNANLTVSASDTRYYWLWREAAGHIYNGGAGWRLSIDELCVGRECEKDKLNVVFSVNTLRVEAAKPRSGG